MSLRPALYILLGLVAVCAAVLSFAALRDLAVVCGFAPGLAPLLPVVVDAGAAAGSLAWLGRVPGRALAFGRTLALVLLASSVAGNALGHALAAYGARPHWAVVVAVSAVAPAVLGAVVHLAVLAGRLGDEAGEPRAAPTSHHGDEMQAGRAPLHILVEDEVPPLGLDWPQPPALAPAGDEAGEQPGDDRAAELIAAGAGRRRLARELDITEHEARQLLAAHREAAG